MFELCSTCLCKDRHLVPLKSLEYVLATLDWLKLHFVEGEQVCWECRALFTKIHNFRQQAWKAQELIRLLARPAQTPKCFPILSKLSTSTKTTYDQTICFDDVIKEELSECGTIHLGIAVEEETTIKTEIQHKSIEDFSNDLFTSNDEYIVQEAVHNSINTNIVRDTATYIPTSTEIRTEVRLSDIFLLKTGYNKHQQSKDEEKFIVRKLSQEEMEKTRDIDRNKNRYMRSPYKCVKCITGYYSEERYNLHVERQHSEIVGKFVCPICEARFNRKEGMEYHHDCHFRSYQCRHCDYEHHKLTTMMIHLNKLHEIKKYQCKQCDQVFLGERQLRYHMDKCHKERQECSDCGKTFATANYLKYHMKIHANTIIARECALCGGSFRNLTAHMRTHEPAREDAYCAECDRQYKSPQCYRKHLEQHRRHRRPGAEPFKCSGCERKFVTKSEMTRHVAAIHTKKYLFYCDACGKGFLQKSVLKYHIMEKHEGISRPKDKICTYCGKGFKGTQTLKVHIRVHTGEKPYKCDHCPWRFSQNSALKTHVRALHLKKDATLEKLIGPTCGVHN